MARKEGIFLKKTVIYLFTHELNYYFLFDFKYNRQRSYNHAVHFRVQKYTGQ